MSLTLLHTADWQLGKPFGSLQDEAKRHRLQDQRLRTVRAMAATIDQTQASLLLVAGDLFDSPHVTKATISSACAAIGSLRIPVFVIPGNHDHGGPDSLWEQEFFLRESRQLAPNLQLLLEAAPLVTEHAVLLPAPLLRRHEPGDPAAWIRSAVDLSDFVSRTVSFRFRFGSDSSVAGSGWWIDDVRVYYGSECSVFNPDVVLANGFE